MEGMTMQFEVQGQNYFLQFNPGEGRWYVLKPTIEGLQGMIVLDDGAPITVAPLLLDEDSKVIN
jgi:hypothetical protein